MEQCNTVSLYTIKLMMIIQGTIELTYNIRSAWFLDIRISTCLHIGPVATVKKDHYTL